MKTTISAFLLFLFFTLFAFPQVLVEEPTSKYQSDEWGFTAAIANQGMGFGGFYLKNSSDNTYIGANLAIYKLRDKYEYTLPSYYNNYVRKINNDNNLYLIPFSIELKRHFFADKFANDIRPYIFSQIGGIFGMNFPENKNRPTYYIDPYGNVYLEEFNDIDLENEFQFGMTLGIGLSLDIATKKKVFFSLKPVYNWIYFPSPIAKEKWHSSLEFQFVIGMRR